MQASFCYVGGLLVYRRPGVQEPFEYMGDPRAAAAAEATAGAVAVAVALAGAVAGLVAGAGAEAGAVVWLGQCLWLWLGCGCGRGFWLWLKLALRPRLWLEKGLRLGR